ncbi:MAG: hypothetical protein WBA01_07985, partial [Phormidesmis sp.]
MQKKYLLFALAPFLIGLGGCLIESSQAGIESADGTTASSTATQTVAQSETLAAADAVNTAALNSVLNTYVDEQGLVDYDALQSNLQQLDAFNSSIQLTIQASFDSWSEAEQI